MNMEIWFNRQEIVLFIQHSISLIGILVILSGIILAVYQYIVYFFCERIHHQNGINHIRLDLSRILILGLEFIVAADLIGSTITPDYYSLGIVVVIVIIRTALSYSLNREVTALTRMSESQRIQ